VFELPRRYTEEIVEHARAEAPNECCGILAGKEGRVLKLYRAVNAEHSPYRYDIDASDLYRINAEVEASGWEFVAIYHSHPRAEAYPSPNDVAMTHLPGSGELVDLWPGVIYLIVSLADPASPRIRAFHIERGTVSEEELHLTD
jgi:[CysO sulfur-carrier protein]-S-L-cysteine hydrolase